MSLLEKKKNTISKVSRWKIIIDKIDNGDCIKLGEGAYGDVYKVLLNETYIAVKVSDTNDVIDFSACFSEGLRVASPLFSNLTECLGVYVDEYQHDKMWRIYTAMECCEGGDLRKFIKEKHDIWEKTVKVLLYSLLKGIADMNKNGTMHRDLKPQNIFLTRKGKISRSSDIKIGDFGLCGNLRLLNSKKIRHTVITRWYRPPEVELEFQYGVNVDVFSIGCVIMEFMTRKPLITSSDDGMPHLKKIIEVLGPLSFQCVDHFEDVIHSDENKCLSGEKRPSEVKYCKQRRAFWESLKKFNASHRRHGKNGKLKPCLDGIPISSKLKGLILRCLDTNPFTRPSAAELLEDSYFDSFKEKVLLVGSPLNLSSPLSRSPQSSFSQETKTVEMADFIRKVVTEFKYSNATFILAFCIFRRYVNVANLHVSNYRKIAMVMINIAATYITEYDVGAIKMGSYLNKPHAGMNRRLFRKLLSECIGVSVEHNIIPSTSCATSINFLSPNSVFVLFYMIENELEMPLERKIKISSRFGLFLEYVPSYTETVGQLLADDDENMFERYYDYFKRECENMFSFVFSDLTLTSVFESDNILEITLSYL